MQELEIRNYKRLDEKDDNAISWPRVAGITAAIAVHAAALLFMLAPMAPPPVAQADEDVTVVNIIKPPPPPPPPPPPEPIKEVIKLKEQPKITPKPQPTPPPPQPPVVFDDPSPMSTPAPPPAPPSAPVAPQPPRAPATPPKPSETPRQAGIDPSSYGLNQPEYPRAELNSGIGGTVTILVTIDANGNVVSARVGKSSGNRNLDRAALDAAKRSKYNAGVNGDGQRVGATVSVDYEFAPE